MAKTSVHRKAETDLQRLGKKIHKQILTSGLSIQQIADMANLAYPTVLSIVNGKNSQMFNYLKVARCLGWGLVDDIEYDEEYVMVPRKFLGELNKFAEKLAG